jgi:hypothetical protein
MLELPKGVAQAQVSNRTSTFEWKWTANFEAFDAFPARLGSTPSGTYRFVVDGQHRAGGATSPYHLESTPFTVSAWEGIQASDLRAEPDGSVSFTVAPVTYPATYTSPFRFVGLDDEYTAGNVAVCRTCAFRPWAETGAVASANVTVYRSDGSVEQVAAAQSGDRWYAPAGLASGDRAVVERGDVLDTYGELNGNPTNDAVDSLSATGVAAPRTVVVERASPATRDIAGPRILAVGALDATLIALVLIALASTYKKRHPS